jgi:ABC-2 type transport system permease protein
MPMSLKRVGILLGKEFLYGSKGYIFIFAIVAPLVISLVVTLIFGTLFTEKPKLGVVDDGSSQMVLRIQELDTLIIREYADITEIKRAVETGAVDIGVCFPADFDSSIETGEETEITVYIWGESLAKNRTIIAVTITNLVREIAGQESPVNIETITLGDEVSIPWSDRLLPFIVIIAVFLGGLMLPATSVINEKNKKTLDALIVTPTSITDVFAAKGLVGIILSLFMGILILVINQAFGSQPLLLVMVLVLGGVMAVEIGLILGILMKDFASLFTIWKSAGIILFAPVFIYLFPQIPRWVGNIFPTYYIVDPIVELSQRGGGWPDIAINVFVLIALDLILLWLVMFTLKKTRLFAT